MPLANLLRKQAVLQQEQGVQRILSTCRLLNVLVVVRGYKTVVRFFPHEAADLERVVDILEAVKALPPGSLGPEDGVAVWEAQAMLLLWLSILILIPFDLATVDSSAVGASSGCVPVPACLPTVWADLGMTRARDTERADSLCGRQRIATVRLCFVIPTSSFT